MDENEHEEYQIDWKCPACNGTTNSQGFLLGSGWAIALHIAGKILAYDYKYLHKNWVKNKVGDHVHDFSTYTINRLAKVLLPYVLEDYENRRHDEEEKIEKYIKKKEASEEPNILAYKYIQKFETQFHQYTRRILEREYGEGERGWWVKGIPYQIRIECAKRREDDTLREEPYSYTDLIDLKDIVDKNWRLFQSELKPVKGYSSTKKELLEAIGHSNEIRKRVMHPIRLQVTEDDITFLKVFYKLIEEQIDKSSIIATNWDKVLIEIHELKNILPSEVIDTFSWFYSEGLLNLIMEKFPMMPISRRLELRSIGIELRESELDEESSLAFNSTFARPLYVNTRLLVKDTGEIKEQCLYFGDIPLVTKQGTFIIDGEEKIFNDDSIKVRSLGNSILNTALMKIKDIAVKRMRRVSAERVTPSGLIDTSLFINAINTFFGSQK